MLVEDEWLVRMDMADAMGGAGWVVVEAGSGEEALSLLGKEPRIDLLITDIRLLGTVNGWDVAEAFRAIHPLVAVIYSTANPAVESRLVPHSVFLPKPSHTDALTAISERLWRHGQPRLSDSST
jgi:CheY-like chemotaxis protein